MMRSKSHLSILAMLWLKAGLSDALSAYQTNLFCQIAEPAVVLILHINFVRMPAVGWTSVREYCSVAGKLNSKSA